MARLGHIESADVVLRFANGITLRLEGGWVESVTRRDRDDTAWSAEKATIGVLDLSIVGGKFTTEVGGDGARVEATPLRVRRLIDLGGA